MMTFIKKIISHILKKVGYSIIRISNDSQEYSVISPQATYSPWNMDENFINIFEKVKNHSLVDIYRMFNLYSLCRSTENLPEGDYIEIGVWRGGTSALMSLVNSKSKVYLCDTFKGVVKTTDQDPHYYDGYHSDTSTGLVNKFFEELKIDNYEILEGIFPEQTAHTISEKKFRLCHIDVDVYESAQDSWNWIKERLVVGGIVIFDDYGFEGCVGVKNFVNTIKADSNYHFQYNLSGQAIFFKIK